MKKLQRLYRKFLGNIPLYLIAVRYITANRVYPSKLLIPCSIVRYSDLHPRKPCPPIPNIPEWPWNSNKYEQESDQ